MSSRKWIGRRKSTPRLGRFNYAPELRAGAVWLLPLLAIWEIYFSPRQVISADRAITYLIAVAVALLAARRPDRCLMALIVLLPFQGLLLAKLWGLGVPSTVVDHMGAWKETLAIAVVLAGARSFISSGRRADALDRLALGFVALVVVYAALQHEIVPSSPSSLNIRLLGFRETAGFVLILLGARHAPLGPEFIRRAGRVLVALGVTVAAIGIFEAIFSSAWNHFVIHTIGYNRYQVAVLHSTVTDPNDIRTYGTIGGAQVLRIGSVLLNPAYLAWYLIPPFAIALERIVRREGLPLMVPAIALMGAAELLTQTRSANLGAVIVAALAIKPAASRRRHWRTRLGILLAGLAVIAVPVAIGTGFTKRIGQIGSLANEDTHGHFSGFGQGVSTIARRPLGQGLGTAAGTGERYNVPGFVIPENNYLEVGDELGVLGGLLFVALMFALIMWLRRLSRVRPDPIVTAMWTAGIGLAVSAYFLQTWESFEVAWTYWGLAGATLAPARARARVVAGAGQPDGARDQPQELYGAAVS